MAETKESQEPLQMPILLLFGAVVVQYVVGLSYSLSRVYTFRASAYDIGAYMQALHSIIHYGIPYSTLQPLGGEINWFGFHFSPLLYFVAPLYALLPSATTLEALYSAILAAAAFPIFFTARSLGLSRWAACYAGIAYLFNPFTLNASIWGFQEGGMAALWIATAAWALSTHRFRWLVISAILLLMTKEHYGLSVIALGLMWWKCYDEKRGLQLACAGFFALLAIFLFIMPHLNGSLIHPMLRGDAGTSRFSWLLNPGLWPVILPQALTSNLEYFATLFGFFCFLPVGGLFWLWAGIADLATNTLSFMLIFRNPFSYYSAALMPLVTIAACEGYRRLRPRFKTLPWRLAIISVFCVSSIYLSLLPLPFSSNTLEFDKPQLALSSVDSQAIDAIEKLEPSPAALGVQDTVGMFFSDHRKLYVFPLIHESLDAVVLRLDFPLKYRLAKSAVNWGNYFIMANQLMNNPDLKIIYWSDPWLVMSRHGNEIPGARVEAQKTLDAFSEREQKLMIDLSME